jgi:hypothetical protein
MATSPIAATVTSGLSLEAKAGIGSIGSVTAPFGAELNRTIIYDPVSLNDPNILPQQTDRAIHRFRLNPRRISFSEEKIVQVVLTKGGWDKQFWRLGSDNDNASGNKLIQIVFEGQTGSLVPPDFFLRQGISDIRLSPAWRSFVLLQDFFRSRNGDLRMIFEGDVYEGHSGTFSFTLEADNPFLVNYRLNFFAYPERIYRIANKGIPFASSPLSILTSGLSRRTLGGNASLVKLQT